MNFKKDKMIKMTEKLLKPFVKKGLKSPRKLKMYKNDQTND